MNKRRSFQISLMFLIFLCLLARPASPQTADLNDAESFDKIARSLFKPIYPSLARQIKEDYAVTGGICVDAGSGPGYLSIELAKVTKQKIYALDIDPAATVVARRNIAAVGLVGRIETVTADVQKMPFQDNFVDLVVSRGSYIFWPDKVRAFKEIFRILKPGGVAFIGGGMGNLLPHEDRIRIQETMEKEGIGPPSDLKISIADVGKILREAGIPCFRVTTDEGCLCGLWIEFQKPSPQLKEKESRS